MAEDMDTNMMVEPTTSHGYPRSKYLMYFLVLLVVLSCVAYARFHFSSRSASSTTDHLTIEANIFVKTYYFMENALPATSNSTSFETTQSVQQFKKLAQANFLAASRQDPSFYNIRRLILIENPGDRSWAIRELLRIPKEHMDSATFVKKISDESQIWQNIYITKGKLPSSTVASYEKQIKEMQLGWYEHLALCDLYHRAGMSKESAKERSAAGISAARSVIILCFLVFCMMLLLFAGIILGINYLIKKEMHSWPGAPNDVIMLPENERSIIGGYLLEVFVVYMLIFVLTQVFLGTAISVVLKSGILPSSIGVVFAQTVQYMVWSGVSLWYLVYRLRLIGWTLKNIGLTTSNIWGEIKWGIGGYASALPLVAAMTLLSQKLMSAYHTPPNPIEPMLMGSDTLLARVILFLLVAVAAPFFEEIFFRGVLFNSLRSRWGLVAGILISAAIFGGVHPLPFGFLPICALGSVFSVVFYQRGSLIPNMIAHSLQNSMAFFLMLLLAS